MGLLTHENTSGPVLGRCTLPHCCYAPNFQGTPYCCSCVHFAPAAGVLRPADGHVSKMQLPKCTKRREK